MGVATKTLLKREEGFARKMREAWREFEFEMIFDRITEFYLSGRYLKLRAALPKTISETIGICVS